MYGPDLATACWCQASYAYWFLGYPEKARGFTEEAVARARAVADPQSLCFALYFAGALHLRWREVPELKARADELIALAHENRFPPFVEWGMLLRGRAKVAEGDRAAGVAALRRTHARLHEAGTGVGRPWHLAILAESLLEGGRTDDAEAALDEADAHLRRTGEWLFEADLYRLRGEVALRRGPAPDVLDAAERWFRRAADTARGRAAKAVELRSVIDLCRLGLERGRLDGLRQRLAETAGWFTEGAETRDLRDARAILGELERLDPPDPSDRVPRPGL
jgi:predicted ATPase